MPITSERDHQTGKEPEEPARAACGQSALAEVYFRCAISIHRDLLSRNNCKMHQKSSVCAENETICCGLTPLDHKSPRNPTTRTRIQCG